MVAGCNATEVANSWHEGAGYARRAWDFEKREPGMVADFAVTGCAMPAVVAAKVLWVAQFKIARVPESALYAGNQRADARSLVVNAL